MLTNLQVSSLACKGVFYWPKCNAKGDPIELNSVDLEMQKWNISTDRAQKVDEKNGVICLITKFTLWSLKGQNCSSFVFSVDDCWFPSEKGMVNRLSQ